MKPKGHLSARETSCTSSAVRSFSAVLDLKPGSSCNPALGIRTSSQLNSSSGEILCSPVL